MDHRILIAAVVGLVLVAFGGFYYALSPRSGDAVTVPRTAAVAPTPAANPQAPAQAQAPAAPPGQITAAIVEAEIAHSDHAALQVLLKKNFADEYKELIDLTVRQRNEGMADDAAGQEMSARFQEMLRPKLKMASTASMALIDKLAGNEINLFHALGVEGKNFCLKVLGKDNTPSTDPIPESIRRMMRLGTFYRFEAIVDGKSQPRQIDGLKPEEMAAFEAGLNRNGLRIEDVRSGAFISETPGDPGKPCLMIERLYRTIAGLDDESRRKLYAGMFFLGRDK